jgi:hypothetical protein
MVLGMDGPATMRVGKILSHRQGETVYKDHVLKKYLSLSV